MASLLCFAVVLFVSKSHYSNRNEHKYIFFHGACSSEQNDHIQCWGKLLLKVKHYNIALLPKK